MILSFIIVLKDLNLRMPREEARDIFQRSQKIGKFPYNSVQYCIDGFISLPPSILSWHWRFDYGWLPSVRLLSKEEGVRPGIEAEEHRIEVDKRRCKMITRVMCVLLSQTSLLSPALLTSYFR